MISKEAVAQSYAAAAGLAPRVYGILLEDGPPKPSGGKIIMQLMGRLLEDVIRSQNGTLTEVQQYRLVSTSLAMDAIGVYHNDPNPLNVMYTNDDFYYIDFGLSKPINPKKNGRFPEH